MTLTTLKQRLKEDSGLKLYSEQVNGLKKKFGDKIICHDPIKSTREKIISAAKHENFFILHANGSINKSCQDKENFFYGVYVWYDHNPNIILAYLP